MTKNHAGGQIFRKIVCSRNIFSKANVELNVEQNKKGASSAPVSD
jgi:hypothetical protein